MTALSILVAPNPLLRKKASPVLEVDTYVKKLLKDLEETMIAEDGIGLAAPQVGISKRILVMNVPANIDVDGAEIEGVDPKPELYHIVNPEIIWASDKLTSCKEGCLSVPGQFASIFRPEEVHVRYLDKEGNQCVTVFSYLQAACIQHEIDHLNGKLFVDYLSSIKRDMLIRKAQKIKK